MFELLNDDVPVIVIIVCISLLAGVYFGSNLYGKRSEKSGPFGSKQDNTLHNGLSWFFKKWELSNWIAVPLFGIHILVVFATMFYGLLGIAMAWDQHVLFFIVALPYAVGMIARFMISRKVN